MEVLRTSASRTPPPLSRRSLIVESDFLILSCLRETLAAAGFEVHCASGPGEARRLLTRHRYDFVIIHLDLNGAGGDAGLDVIARAREWNPQTQIVALGSDAETMPTGLYEALGADVCYATTGSLDRLRVQIATMARTPRTPGSSQESTSW
jgi:DNA-binding response OmpR family regulator